VEIQYINQLKAHLSGDGVLVTIPTSIAPRYGSSPICASSSTVSPAENGLKIQVEVSSSVPIRKLESRTHPISVELGYTSGPAIRSSFAALAVASATGPPNAEFDPRKARATLSDKSTSLGRDFVLLVFASNKNILTSSAILEQHPTLRGLSALQVNISPGQLFTPEGAMDGTSSEIIFLADRSGSMGDKIKVLQSALSKSIKSIPPNYSFNIHSFGSSQSALWKDSRLCTQENVDLALQHLTNDFTANMGGTEILSALQNAVHTRTRREDMKTEIILLTDGEAWDADHIIEFVRDTRTETNQKVRFFALGIGDAVSHRLVEGIGRQGGGFAEIVAVDAIGNWEAEVIRMLKGALTPSQWQCKVELPEGSGTAHSMSFEEFLPTQLPIPRPIAIQAPYKTPFFHAFTRTSVYFFLDPQQLAGRSKITIEGVESSGKTFRTDIPLEEVQSQSQTIHSLAAKALMTDLETGQSWMHADKHHEYRIKNSNDFERHVQQEAEQIGMKWSISGKWTSFVAVGDDGQEAQKSRIYLAERSELADLTRPRGATYTPTYNQDNRGFKITDPRMNHQMQASPLPSHYTLNSSNELRECTPAMHSACREFLNCPYPNCKRHTGNSFPSLWHLNHHLRHSHTDTHLPRLYTMTLKEIISLQTVEGSFSLPGDLNTTFQDIYTNSDVVNTIKNEMQTKSRNTDAENEIAAKIFITLLIISIIVERFSTEIDMWSLVARKAYVWVHGYLKDGRLGWIATLRISYAKWRNP
jgi:uncharacterized protein YegL